MIDIIHRLPEVKTITGLSRSTIYELIRRNEFPQPVPLGLRAVGWIDSEIKAWLKERIASRVKH